MSNAEYCEFGQRCGDCTAAGLAPRTRAVMEGVIQTVSAGFEGQELEENARDWLKSIDPPKNAPDNPELGAALAGAATKIATGNCDSYKYW